MRKALQKAKQARSEYNPDLFEMPSVSAPAPISRNGVEETQNLEPEVVTPIEPKENKAIRGRKKFADVEGKDVQVVYSHTKVHAVDPQILKRNKLIALFPEMEAIEEIKILRTQVLNKLEEIGGNTILVSSANSGEGKTFTCINLGISIAQELNRTVLIIDADLRDHTRKHYNFAKDFFSINNDKGLSDYLLRKCELPDLLLNPGIEKLTVIPAGNPLINASELLGSNRMETLVAEVKERYKDRIIIIDGPAALDFPDPTILSKYVDGVLMVVEIEKTTSEQIQKIIKLFENVPLLGAVANKAK
jgi:non-specific protein-tyrosine kinase